MDLTFANQQMQFYMAYEMTHLHCLLAFSIVSCFEEQIFIVSAHVLTDQKATTLCPINAADTSS